MAERFTPWTAEAARRLAREHGAVALADEALRRVAAGPVPEAWITVTPVAALRAQAERVDERIAAGEHLPLAGVPFAVKDNIDVAGLPTTAGCPEFAFDPAASAPVVQRLLDAGALCAGKTNLDQFATGLVGTRAPAYGACPNPFAPEFVAGGSSSGSAVAVATGEVVFALGTDTAGSGRVPAANCGVVGLKPSLGVLPTVGVVPAMPSFDVVSIFASSVADAAEVLAAARTPGRTTPMRAGGRSRIGVVAHDWSGDAEARNCFDAALGRLSAMGADLVEVDGGLLAEAGALVYESAFVLERVGAFGAFAAAHPGAVHPATVAILERARGFDADDLVDAMARLAELRERATALWAGIDALVVPTVIRVPTLQESLDDWFAPSAELGRTTAFANPLRMCAVSVPSCVRSTGVPFGVTFAGPPGADDDAVALAARFVGEPELPPSAAHTSRAPAATSTAPGSAPAIPLAVVGAHLRGQPLHHQLTDRDARFVAATTTTAQYRLYALDTDPPKPGLVRVDDGGVAVEVEVWSLDAAAFGDFVAAIPAPLGVGKVRLADGTEVTGFLCEPVAVTGARDISHFGGWRPYLAAG